MQNVSVVSCVSDFEKYDRFVRGSFKTGRQSGAVELLAIDNTSNRYSAPAALNKGLEKAVGDIIVFCHQDVVFPEKWIESLAGQIAIIEDMCENWGVLETLSFIKDNAISKFDMYVLTPFPGTPIWEYAKSRDLVSDAMDWDKLNVNFESNYREAIMLSEKLTREEIYRLFQLFVRFKKGLRRKARLKKKVERLKSFLARYCGYSQKHRLVG